MNVVSYDEYYNEKKHFFQKHRDFQVETKGTSAEYYSKTYVFDDGAIWYEVMRRVSESGDVEIKKCKVNVEIDFLQTEFWSNENSESAYYYEVWDNTK